MVDAVDDIQSDESGINMSFNNPLFSEKEAMYNCFAKFCRHFADYFRLA